MTSKPESDHPHWGVVFIGLALTLLAGLARWTWHTDAGLIWHFSDDAMITARVAAVFAETGAPFYNPDEAVAASTSLFWPILLSPIHAAAGPQGAIICVYLTGAVLSVLVARAAAGSLAPGFLQTLVFFAVALSPPFLFYGPNGWEHIPQALLITLGLAQVLRASGGGGLSVPTSALVLICLSFIFRVDSAPIILVVGLAWLLTEQRYLRPRTYVIAAALLLIPLGYFGAMLFYFGNVVPNTAYLKVLQRDLRIELGIAYILEFSRAGHAVFLLVLAVVCALAPPARSPAILLVLAALGAQSAYVVFVGGDVFTFGRFFLIVLPGVTAILALQLGALIPTRAGLVFGLIVAVGFVAAGSLKLARDDVEAAFFPDRRNDELIKQQLNLVATINERIGPDDGSIGLHYLGIGYHLPDFHIVDFLGKAEPVIARTEPKSGPLGHNKWDYPYAFSTYQIAALPMPERTVQLVTSASYAHDDRRGLQYWEDAAVEALALGYVFIPPTRLGNAAGEAGLFVRADLADRFP